MTWYDTIFAARIDPGRDMMKWPRDFQEAVTHAVIMLRQKNPRLGRVMQISSRVDDHSEIIGFPYRICVSLLVEEITLQ